MTWSSTWSTSVKKPVNSTPCCKVADNYDEEVKVMTEGLTKLIEPLLIVFLGVAVGFIVIALFLPMIEMITTLSK